MALFANEAVRLLGNDRHVLVGNMRVCSWTGDDGTISIDVFEKDEIGHSLYRMDLHPIGGITGRNLLAIPSDIQRLADLSSGKEKRKALKAKKEAADHHPNVNIRGIPYVADDYFPENNAGARDKLKITAGDVLMALGIQPRRR